MADNQIELPEAVLVRMRHYLPVNTVIAFEKATTNASRRERLEILLEILCDKLSAADVQEVHEQGSVESEPTDFIPIINENNLCWLISLLQSLSVPPLKPLLQDLMEPDLKNILILCMNMLAKQRSPKRHLRTLSDTFVRENASRETRIEEMQIQRLAGGCTLNALFW